MMISNCHPDFWLMEELFQAYYQARQNKRNTINQLEFEFQLEANLMALFDDVKYRRYQLLPSIAFVVTQPTVREIFAASFRDRVIHHFVCNLLMPYWDKKFIFDSYSCRAGKGTHFGMRRIYRFLRAASANFTRPAYVMKLDIKSYFIHISRAILWEMLQRSIVDPRAPFDQRHREVLLYLLPIIIFTDPTSGVRVRGSKADWAKLPPGKSLFTAPPGCGFPIGNLTSQLFSNIYLHALDCFVKYQLGFRYYGRYVDDFILIDESKDKLLQAKEAIRQFLHDRLQLQLHPKKMYLQPVLHGVEFLGGFIGTHGIFPGRRLLRNFHRFEHDTGLTSQGKQGWKREVSYLGQLSNYDGKYGQMLQDKLFASDD